MTTNDATMKDFRCAIHDRPLVRFCPVCRGTRGGLVTTPRKRQSSRRNLRQARAAQHAQRFLTRKGASRSRNGDSPPQTGER
jgi:hypothetical protein